MQRTFDAFWDYVRHPTQYTNMMLGPLPEHVQRVFGGAVQNEAIAYRFAYGYANPHDFENWLMDPAKTDAYLASFTDPQN